MKILYVTLRQPHGKEIFDPAEGDQLAQRFCELLGQKSLTRKNIEAIKALGYEIRLREKKPKEVKL